MPSARRCTIPASGRRWTYAELWSDAGRLASALQAHGIEPGDAVVFSLFNGPEFVLTWLAAQRLGAIPAPINFRLSAGEVAHVLDDSLPRAYVYDQALQRTAADALDPGRARAPAPGRRRRGHRLRQSRSRSS